jgi:hypothetical protein
MIRTTGPGTCLFDGLYGVEESVAAETVGHLGTAEGG